MPVWTSHKIDGQYLGQTSALAPQVAFCQLMSVLGRECLETDLEALKIEEDSYRITYGSEEFLLRRDPKPTSE
jgi:hypothetical protein